MAEAAAATVLESHAVNQTLQRLIDTSESSDYVESRELLDDNRKAVLDRAFLFSRKLQGLIGASTDADVSLPGLTVVNNNLTNALNEIGAFFSNKNPGHIDNANTHLDAATTTATWTFFKVQPKGARAHSESIASVRKAASEAISDVKNEQAETTKQIAQTRESLETQQQSLSALAEKISQTQQATDSAVSEVRTSFSTIESEFRKNADAAESKKAASFETLVKKLDKQSNEVLKTLAGHEADAKRIVQIVGNVGVTGNYQNRAQEELAQANLWRLVTVALFGTGVILVAASLIMHLADRVDLTTLITRFAIAVAITIPAFYTARESARHRTNADRAKQTELELASLGPFLETLPTEQRQEIIAALAKEYFGRVVDPHTVNPPVTAEEVQKTIAATANLIGKVKGP